MSFFRKIGKHYLCSEGKKRCAFSLQLSVFGKWYFFWCPFKVTKHYKNRGFSGHRGKPKMALLIAKVPFWVFPRKGALLSVMPKSCVLFSKTQLCRHERMQLEQKQIFTKNRGCLPKCKKVFFLVCFFCFLVVLFFVACVLVLVFCKKGPKRLFSRNFKGFLSILFPQKACLKVFFFFLFCFFCFCLPFQNSILSLCFLAISPFLENINIFGFFFFLFLAFSFLNVCLFLSNKLS